MDVAIDLIKPSPYQPRLSFNLEDLKGSIIRDGILVPLTLRQKDDYYELIDGERRLRLAKELGYKTIRCEIIEADDETADRMIWKVNTLRKDYEPKEKALHYQMHQGQGMSLRGIARDHDDEHNNVLALLNVLKLPEKYQNEVWDSDGRLSVAHIRELDFQFNQGGAAAPVISNLDIAIERKLNSREFHDFLHPQRAKTQTQRVEAAQQAAAEFEPELKRLETPEDYERAAEALKREAQRQREEAMTPEEIAALEAEKNARAEAQAAAKARREEEKRQQKAEEERRRQEQAERKARAELRGNKAFVQEALKTLPQEERLELLDLTPMPEKPKEPKALSEQFQEVIREASQLVTRIEKLRAAPGFQALNLKPFALDLYMLADAFTELSEKVGGSHE